MHNQEPQPPGGQLATRPERGERQVVRPARPRRGWLRLRRDKDDAVAESRRRRRLWRRRTSRRPHQPSLLANETFRRFWLSRLLTQTAQAALVYALLIIVVDETDASFYNSLFV